MSSMSIQRHSNHSNRFNPSSILHPEDILHPPLHPVLPQQLPRLPTVTMVTRSNRTKEASTTMKTPVYPLPGGLILTCIARSKRSRRIKRTFMEEDMFIPCLLLHLPTIIRLLYTAPQRAWAPPSLSIRLVLERETVAHLGTTSSMKY